MFDSTTTSLTMVRDSSYGYMVAELSVQVSTTIGTAPSVESANLVVNNSNHEIYYGMLNDIRGVKDFCIQTTSYDARSFVETAFAEVETFEPRSIPAAVSIEHNAYGNCTIRGRSGYKARLPLPNELNSNQEAIRMTEDHLIWAIRSYYYEDLLDRLIKAQHQAMTFSRAGYKTIEEKFEPLFESTRIKVPIRRLTAQ